MSKNLKYLPLIIFLICSSLKSQDDSIYDAADSLMMSLEQETRIRDSLKFVEPLQAAKKDSIERSQDTLIAGMHYRILSRHTNGKVKSAGQFSQGCSDTLKHKHGNFITFDSGGREKKRRTYFYGGRVNKKILGIKYGWWGFYGLHTKYLFGVKRVQAVVDPCF